MKAILGSIALLLLATPLVAQNLVSNGNFEAGPTGWTMTSFNDPLGTTGFAVADVISGSPSMAVFADFQTLTPVMSATYKSLPFNMPAGPIDISYNVMWEKTVTTPIPSVTVNRVELRLVDAATASLVTTFTLTAPNQTGLQERASFAVNYNVATAGSYYVEVFMRHSNLANMPYTTWVDDVVIGSPCAGSATAGGQGCADSTGTRVTLSTTGCPDLGAQFTISVATGASMMQPIQFIVGLSDQLWLGVQLPLDLTLFGAPGCSLYTSQEFLLTLPNPGGGASLSFPIPTWPGLVGGTTHWQCLFIDPPANSLGIVTSDYMTVVVG